MNFDAMQFKCLERAGYDRIGPRYLAAAGARSELAYRLASMVLIATARSV